MIEEARRKRPRCAPIVTSRGRKGTRAITERRSRRSRLVRLWPVALALGLYAVAVSAAWRRAAWRADLRGCVEVHALQDQVVLLAGLLLGLAAGAGMAAWADRLLHALFPGDTATRRRTRLRWAAGVVLILGALANALWVGAPLDLFLDTHLALLVDVDLLLVVMGVLQGGAWQALLDRDAPWLALPLMPAMALMLIASGVVGRGWC